MSEHTVTEHITQTGGHITARLDCSCGVVVEDDTRKTSRRALRSALAKLHEIDLPKPKKSELKELREAVQKEIKKQKKSSKQKPAVESEKNWDDEAQYVDEPQ